MSETPKQEAIKDYLADVGLYGICCCGEPVKVVVRAYTEDQFDFLASCKIVSGECFSCGENPHMSGFTCQDCGAVTFSNNPYYLTGLYCCCCHCFTTHRRVD